jgi:hypothetical protein
MLINIMFAVVNINKENEEQKWGKVVAGTGY